VGLSLALLASPYLRRYTFLMYADVYDYDKLPARGVSRSVEPFRFPDAGVGDWIAPLGVTFGGQAISGTEELERFLSEHGTTAFVAVEDGRLLDERYFKGFRRDSLFKSFSVTKSVVSGLIGRAIADGLIGSVDDPVTKYVPEMKDTRFAGVTLRHCLDATDGIRYSRGVMPWRDQVRMYYTTDVRHHVLGTVIDADPGTRFSPNDLGPLVLGCVLERAIRQATPGRTLSDYLAETVWKPIGAEYDALWNVDREDGGIEKAESGLTVRAIDLVKLGVLYLDGGQWGGRQVLPAEWVARTNVMPSDRPRPNAWDTGFHRLQWWGRKVAPPGPHDFYANGHFGQRLYVSPRSRLVLLRMGDSNEGVDWAEFLGTIADAFARRGAAAAE